MPELLASAVHLLRFCVICEEEERDADTPRVRVRLFIQHAAFAEQRNSRLHSASKASTLQLSSEKILHNTTTFLKLLKNYIF